MVVCKYFQQGNCRFGTSCTNEHFDVKQIIKSDMETALNSKQWPLSCYGPFKDKPCIPNFIEDQSFDEVRQMCYDARQKNYFEQFNQQFTQKVIEANNRMKSMLQPSTQLIELACKIYDTQLVDTARPGQNVFANAAVAGNTNAFGNSIFNKNSTNTSSTGHIFGNNNLFGATTTQPQTTSIFGQQGTTNNSNNNGTNQPSNVGFSFVNNNNTNLTSGNNSGTVGSLFGNTAQAQSGASLFAAQQNQAGGVGLFSQQQQQQQTQGQGISGTAAFSNLFSQQANMPTTQTNTTVFNQNPFGQQQPQQQAGSGIFSQQSNNMFMSQQQQQQQQQPAQQLAPSGLFAQQQVQPATNAAVAGANIFSQQGAQQQQQTQPQQGVSNNQQAIAPTGFFQQSAQQTAAPPSNSASSVYSRMEDLTPEEIEAFQSPIFLPGKIPCCPPPREFVN